MTAFDETPLARQWRRLKQEAPEGALLLVVLGDFLELFCEDAYRAASVCGLDIHTRGGVAVAGFPRHCADRYLDALTGGGMAVAIADQMEPLHRGARICRREITRVILPHETKTQHNTPPSVL